MPEERPVLDLLTVMTEESIARSGLDAQTLVLVRIAALVAVDAPPASYLLNLGAAADLEVTGEQVQDVLLAVAPLVGTARTVAAAGNITKALGFAIDVLSEDD